MVLVNWLVRHIITDDVVVCVGSCWLGSCRCMCKFMLVGIMLLYVQVHVGWDHVVVCVGSCWLGSRLVARRA